ncbi:hypothetical protein [Xylophilus sp. Leaf220]|uniref:hypothetical protein n=1 Tax=Xylophilus sp. Leaf220 TaxID=1735686 RepID=UPI0006F1D753|nr:hypothetical protein [Xylophilus sp. Leaf220]KQM79840.1 hypothetical protein ASE76_01140 [Xylophilus sp. Leaf220]
MSRRLDNPALDFSLIGVLLMLAVLLGCGGLYLDGGPDEPVGMEAQADEAAHLQAQYAADNALAASARARHPSTAQPPRRIHESVLVAAGGRP